MRKRLMLNRTTILSFLTMRCQLHCSYCHFEFHPWGFNGYGRKVEVGAEKSWIWWLEQLNRFRPYFLEFTGGEPLLHPGFKNLVAHIPADSKWAITSNTLLNVDNIELTDCFAWTASYHYHDMDKFLGNCQKLRVGGLAPRISLVCRPDNFGQMTEAVNIFIRKQFGVNLLRELRQGLDWAEYPLVWQKIKDFGGKIGVKIIEEEIPSSYKFPVYENCTAGVGGYFATFPDGKVFRCYSEAMLRGADRGTLDKFEWMADTACGQPCAACAQDFKQKKWSK